MGDQCPHLVLSRAQGRVKSEFKAEEGLMLKLKGLGAIGQW